jgi:hypothetical protein
MNFSARLDEGRAGESAIARWLRLRGSSVLPVYEKLIDDGKGPRLFTPAGQLVAPDLVVFRHGGVMWIEAKHKEAFSWHRITKRWTTGIDAHHYREYQDVSRIVQCPVWLLFLHRGGQAKDSPATSPSGLYGNDLAYLSEHVNHTSPNWGRHGMVYRAIADLLALAPLSELCPEEPPVAANMPAFQAELFDTF